MSNTEKMAILPMWVIDRIKAEMRLGPAAWQAIDEAINAAEAPEVIPCEVKLPPATTFGKGVSVASLLMAIKQREKFADHFLVFSQPAAQHQGEPSRQCPNCKICIGTPLLPVGCIIDNGQYKGEQVAWTSGKPEMPGAYWIRGNGLDRPALVEVAIENEELRCNLHDQTSCEDFGFGYSICQLNDAFEWCGPLYLHPPTTNVLARSTPQTKARLIDSFGREP